MTQESPTRALVLSGGGARGAYEAGVLRYIFDVIPKTTGEPVDFDIVSGTSVGAINSAWVASTLNEPAYCGQRMWYLWRTLEFADVIQPSYTEIWRLARQFLGGTEFLESLGLPEWVLPGEDGSRHGGLLDVSFFEDLVRDEIPFQNIARNLSRGLLEAFTVSTTDVVSGRTTVFAQTASGEVPPWTRDPRRVAVGGAITADKVLASAAIPILFPAVQIGNRWFSDGGLRQNTPLTPALRLGADRVLVVTLHSESIMQTPAKTPSRSRCPVRRATIPTICFCWASFWTLCCSTRSTTI
ncbi:MAG: patatin-like phospholipase family protein [Bradymonadaceae bacterium]